MRDAGFIGIHKDAGFDIDHGGHAISSPIYGYYVIMDTGQYASLLLLGSSYRTP